MRLVVIGGGIAGLAAARFARSAGADVTLIESTNRLGGKILTKEIGGVPIELGPDSFVAFKPAAADLARALGLGGELVGPGQMARRTYLLTGGRLRELPEGLAMGVPTGLRPLIRTVSGGIIGPLAAARAAMEPLIPRGSGDPSVEEEMRRRLGRRAADRLVAPLVSGIFGAPASQISMKAAFPQFASTRSLVLAMAHRPRLEGPAFLTIRGGLQRLPEALEKELSQGAVRIIKGVGATSIERRGNGYRVLSEPPAQERPIEADSIVLATPADTAASLLKDLAPQATTWLQRIPQRSSAVLVASYDRKDIGRELDTSGYLVAPGEDQTIAACTLLTLKWPHIEWESRFWLRAVVNDPQALAAGDDELTARALAEIGRTMQGSRDPGEVLLRRWPRAMPVYSPGHEKRVEEAEAVLPEGIALAGASYRGPGISDCVAGGEAASRMLLESR